MKKKIEDFLHLYCGGDCYCVCTSESPDQRRELDEHILLGFRGEYHLIKPILRPLSSMTEEEAIEYFDLPTNSEILKKHYRKEYIEFEYRWVDANPKLNIEDGYSYSSVAIGFDCDNLNNNPEHIKFLLSKSFDLFGLIESGLAIEKL